MVRLQAENEALRAELETAKAEINRLKEIISLQTNVVIPKKRGRRAAAVLYPVGLARQGEDILRSELDKLTIEQLKDVVGEYAMDPMRKVMGWKDHARIINHIVELAIARATKGHAFR